MLLNKRRTPFDPEAETYKESSLSSETFFAGKRRRSLPARFVDLDRQTPMLLIYCYATGRFGSRTIEAPSCSDVAVRYLCTNHHPDHDSICTFRTANKQAFKAAFVR